MFEASFTLFSSARGWHCDALTGWCIYNPWSFTPYYAVHGYNSVPSYPASSLASFEEPCETAHPSRSRVESP